MKIELTQVTIGDLVEGYADNSATEEGVVGYGGRLNIRPKYQREFVYDEKKRNAVIETVWKGFPVTSHHTKMPTISSLPIVFRIVAKRCGIAS